MTLRCFACGIVYRALCDVCMFVFVTLYMYAWPVKHVMVWLIVYM